MTRLLFAAARGAQIDRKHDGSPQWEDAKYVWLDKARSYGYEYRIHPDDEHLQYGPISSALRENAKDTDGHTDPCTAETVFGHWWLNLQDNIAFDYLPTVANDHDVDLTRSLSLLILAEALADEGV